MVGYILLVLMGGSLGVATMGWVISVFILEDSTSWLFLGISLLSTNVSAAAAIAMLYLRRKGYFTFDHQDKD